ncbi:MAG: uroporphyrinogen decarboxylase family protein [Anaerolineae bacterium]
MTIDKRAAVLSLLDAGRKQEYVPAAFFLHFDPSCHRGQAAVDKHLEYFHYTGMDVVKIQYENAFPHLPQIARPDDWAQMPLYGKDFYAEQIKVVEELVKAAKHEALVIVTLYSPFMCAGQTAGGQATITAHIKQDPEKVKKGIEIITESMMIFVKGCIEVGVDGFYASTQGGESDRFEDAALFETCVKPYDLTIMEEINRACSFNVLHVCDYHGGYSDLTPFLDYPGDVVNCSLKLGSRTMTPQEVSTMFGRPYMGGMDRHGIIVSGSANEIAQTVGSVLARASTKFFLAADCTLPNDIDWNNIRTAIATAHARGKEA